MFHSYHDDAPAERRACVTKTPALELQRVKGKHEHQVVDATARLHSTARTHSGRQKSLKAAKNMIVKQNKTGCVVYTAVNVIIKQQHSSWPASHKYGQAVARNLLQVPVGGRRLSTWLETAASVRASPPSTFSTHARGDTTSRRRSTLKNGLSTTLSVLSLF